MNVRHNLPAAVGLCFLIAVLEGFDIQAIGVAASRLAQEFGFDRGKMGWIFGSLNVGLVIGAIIGGRLADKLGRKTIFIAAVAIFGVFTLLTAYAGRFDLLLCIRFAAGLGIGAALPNMMAIAAEISRPEKAALTAAMMFCGMPVGGGLSALATQLLPAGYDWRILFQLGGILPLVLIPMLVWLMPETLSRTSASQVEKPSIPTVLFGGGRASATLLLWLTFLPTLLILYLFLNWLPTLVTDNGFDAATSPRTSLAFNFCSVAGALLFGQLADRFNYRWPLALAYVAVIASLIQLKTADSETMMIVMSGAVGFFLLGANYALYGVAPKFYPKIMRATGSGASIAVGRVGAIVGPLLPGFMMTHGGTANTVLQTMIPIAAIAGVAVFALSFQRTPAP
jgi:MFS transporter, AAHS family, 3-hydroxyphenylpropionic acid transporter